MKACAPCPNYNHGQGTKGCLVCEHIEKYIPAQKTSTRERLLGDTAVDRTCEDYKDIIWRAGKHIQNQKYYNSLSRKHQAAIALKASQAFTLTEIAAILRVSKSTVWRIWLRLQDH